MIDVYLSKEVKISSVSTSKNVILSEALFNTHNASKIQKEIVDNAVEGEHMVLHYRTTSKPEEERLFHIRWDLVKTILSRAKGKE